MELEDYKQKMNLNNADLGWFWLDSFKFLTLNKKHKIYNVIKKGDKIFDLKKYEKQIKDICDNDYYKLLECANNDYLKLIWKEIDGVVDFISIENPLYPEQLKNIDIPPIVLYYKGDLSLLKTNIIAIVGTRMYDNYGYVVTQKFVKELSNSGVTILSTLSEGLDTICHNCALENKGKTIAVISGGINKIYPSLNTELAKQIANKGLVIGEWRPNVETMNFMFQMRARLVAGLSNGVLVTEAGMRSGVKYITDYAEMYNRTIYAIPGNVTSYKSSYTNYLIKNCQSMLVSQPKEILDEMNIVYIPIKEKEDVSDEEAKIFAVLDDVQEAHFDYIASKTEIPSRKLLTILTGLEISKKVKKMAGNKYVKII